MTNESLDKEVVAGELFITTGGVQLNDGAELFVHP